MANKIKYPVVNGFKLCGSCRATKPVTEFHKIRHRYCSSCKSCRNLYHANYRQRPEVKAAALEYSRSYRAIPENRNRLNEYMRIFRKQPRIKLVRNAARKAWTAREKQKAVDYKGGKCVCCGYSGCLAAMDFHHRNPKAKEGYGTGALVAHWTFERNRPELDKCELVCVRCHREIHAGVRTL